MKRILSLILALGFFACIGIESFHHHVQKSDAHCPLCFVKAQIHSRATLHSIPKPAAVFLARIIENTNPETPVFNSLRDLSARSPPFILA